MASNRVSSTGRPSCMMRICLLVLLLAPSVLERVQSPGDAVPPQRRSTTQEAVKVVLLLELAGKVVLLLELAGKVVLLLELSQRCLHRHSQSLGGAAEAYRCSGSAELVRHHANQVVA